VSLDLRARLGEAPLLFDGGTGTTLYDRGAHLGQCFDAFNLDDPDLVRGVHRDYVKAGAQVIQTNSFGANAFKLGRHHMPERMEAINKAGAALARAEAGGRCLVAGSIGPLGVRIEPWGRVSRAEARAAFRDQAAALAAGGVDLFVLETFANPVELIEAVAGAREAAGHLPIVAQMTLTEDGRSLDGAPIEEVLPRVAEAADPDAIGLNCSVGPELMLGALERLVKVISLPLSVQPNAGFPKQMEERTFYLSSPDYFARYGLRLIEAGARIVGGCCGTTPDHIRALERAMRVTAVSFRKPIPLGRIPAAAAVRDEANDPTAAARLEVSEAAPAAPAPVPMEAKSRLAAKIAAGRPVACVELLPPRGWGLDALLATTRAMSKAGYDAVNIPDGPRAMARLSPLAAAVSIERDIEGMETILHYVCRDRNLLGMQADLLGAYTLGLRNLLLITGDPPVHGDYPEATAVFDVDSIGLTNLVNRLNHGSDVGGRGIGQPTGFLIGVGANPTAISFEREVERFYWKVDAGAEFAITQPVFDLEALERFLDAIADFRVPVLAGIWPLQSLRNAEFLNNEVPGVSIPEPIMARMRAAGGNPEAERETGMQIALEMARGVLPRLAGVQVSAPFNRGEIAGRLLAELAPDLAAKGSR
jgi:homocysteine S-methyltransferase